MLDPAKSYDIRTVELAALPGAPLRAACALTHQTKNLNNTGVFLVRQVVSAYDYDREAEVSRLRTDLHPFQIDAIGHFNRTIDAVNAAREAKHPADVAKAEAAGRKPPVLKLVPRLEATVESVFAIVLDPTVLDTALKTRPNEDGVIIYRRLPAAAAQQVMHRVREAFSSYLQASKRFAEDPAGMTGRPQMPGYLGKRDRFPVEVPYSLVKRSLPEPKEKLIPEDDFAPEVSFVPPEALRAFYDFDFRAAIAEACGRRKWAEYKPQHLRIVPLHRGVRVEAVVRIPNPYPAGSFLAGLVAAHGDALKGLKDDKARDRWLLAHLGGLGGSELPRIAGIDLGVGNLAAVAYSTGHRAAVHTGGRFTANLDIFSQGIAERVAVLTPERVRTLQAKKLDLAKRGEKLPRTEEIELRTLLKALYADDEYRRLTAKQARWAKDYLHKLSTRMVEDCVRRGIQVIVIGRTIGWKQEVGMGRDQNRKFCQTAHARLIDLIRYKAESRGIAVVTTEESYTSKTSFVNDDELETFAEKTQDKADPKPPVERTGRRSSTDRNWFRHKNRHDRWAWVHADVNGAFNIIRKVFRTFVYHSGLTLKFTLFRLSPRLGVTPLACA